MKRILIYFGLFLTPIHLCAQNLEWANLYSFYNDDYGSALILSMAMAPDGNIVSLGRLKGALDLDPSSAVFEIESTSSQFDYFITRNAPDGSFISAIQIAGASAEMAPLAIDADNNTYALSTFQDSFDFDPSSNVVELIPSYQGNVALTKYDDSGNLVWVKHLGSSNYLTPNGLTVDALGNVYVSVSFGVDLLVDSEELYSVFTSTVRSALLKIDSSGSVSWYYTFNDNTTVNKMAISPSGKLYIVGEFFGTSDFDLSDTEFPLTANGSYDAFMSVYNTDGSLETAFNIGKGQFDAAHSLAFYPNNDVVMVGEYLIQIDCTPNGTGSGLTTAGAKDGSFIAKYDADLNLLWQRQVGFSADTFNSDVAIDSEGNVCTIGWFKGTANFDPADTYLNEALTSTQTDGFLSKLSSDGDYVYGGKFTGTSDYDRAKAIVAGENGAIYIGGYFNNNIDIDPGDEELILTTTGGDNGFLIKMDNYAVSAESISNKSTVNAYPNPSTGIFTIQSTQSLEANYIHVYNQLGQKTNASIVQSGNQLSVQIDNAKGIYFLDIHWEDGSRSSAKLIKE